jgi:hypothetical protein
VIVALREIAVLVPADAAPALERASLVQTFTELAGKGDRASTSWRGWAAHRGTLHQPIDAEALAKLEKDIGALPDDYRAFVRDVAAAGAGPGYGLLSPDHPEQRRLADGDFPYAEDNENAEEPACGVLALAHGGCSAMWLLVLRGPRRGEVWVDAGGSDRGMRRVAASFTDWYRDWLHACALDLCPWIQWDSGQCSTPAALSQFLRSVEQKEGLTGEAAVARLRSGIRPVDSCSCREVAASSRRKIRSIRARVARRCSNGSGSRRTCSPRENRHSRAAARSSAYSGVIRPPVPT